MTLPLSAPDQWWEVAAWFLAATALMLVTLRLSRSERVSGHFLANTMINAVHLIALIAFAMSFWGVLSLIKLV